MRLAEYIDPELVLVNLQADQRTNLFEPLVEKICRVHPAMDKNTILKSLREREEKYSTGLESGIAVPHALVAGVEKPVCLVARLADPIDFGTMDGSPVRILFLLISPKEAIATHIRILARIARLCTIPSFLDRMFGASDAAELYEIIRGEDQRHV